MLQEKVLTKMIDDLVKISKQTNKQNTKVLIEIAYVLAHERIITKNMGQDISKVTHINTQELIADNVQLTKEKDMLIQENKELRNIIVTQLQELKNTLKTKTNG